MTLRICADCRHYRYTSPLIKCGAIGRPPLLEQPENGCVRYTEGPVDLVTGEVLRGDCRALRALDGTCGTEGLGWEPKV